MKAIGLDQAENSVCGSIQKAKRIPPISGNVDCDVAYKNYPLIIKALHLNNFK